jgi:hypothetical protein
MRTVWILAIALLSAAPVASLADTTPQGLSQMVAAYGQVQAVRVIERFENGATATVDVMPSGQYRVAETGGQDPSLIVKIATEPADGAVSTGTYTVTSLGNKSIDGAKVEGYKIAAPDGTYTSSVWINEHHLPVQAHVETQGHRVDVVYGDYNSSALIATPK